MQRFSNPPHKNTASPARLAGAANFARKLFRLKTARFAVAGRFLLLTAFMFCINSAGGVSGTTDIFVDGKIQYQKINGFEITIVGTLADASGYGLALSDINSQLVNDFGFNYIKVRIDEMAEFEPSNDNSDPMLFNWTAYQAAFSKSKLVKWFQDIKSISASGAQIHLSTFKPPLWMAQQLPPPAPSGRYQLNPGYPRPELYQEIAELWAAILVHLRDRYNVDVESIVIWNEPHEKWGPFRFTPAEFTETVKALGRRFQREKLKTKIFISDDVSVGTTLNIVKRVLNDSEAAQYAGGIAYHTYDNHERSKPDYFVNVLQKLSQDPSVASSGLELRMTEWAPEVSNQCLVWAKQIYNCHVFGRTSVVDLWYVGPLAWSTDKACSIESNGAGGISWRKQIYAFKQFAKFIEPGSRRIKVSPTVASGTDIPALSAYLHPTSGRLTLAATNLSAAGKTVKVSFQHLSLESDFDVYRTSSTENCVFVGKAALQSNELIYVLPALSITTFTAKGRL